MSNSPSETRSGKHATLYRMVMEKHICPWGLKSKDLGAGEHSPGRSIV
jgi:hypothetical protein